MSCQRPLSSTIQSQSLRVSSPPPPFFHAALPQSKPADALSLQQSWMTAHDIIKSPILAHLATLATLAETVNPDTRNISWAVSAPFLGGESTEVREASVREMAARERVDADASGGGDGDGGRMRMRMKVELGSTAFPYRGLQFAWKFSAFREVGNDARAVHGDGDDDDDDGRRSTRAGSELQVQSQAQAQAQWLSREKSGDKGAVAGSGRVCTQIVEVVEEMVKDLPDFTAVCECDALFAVRVRISCLLARSLYSFSRSSPPLPLGAAAVPHQGYQSNIQQCVQH